MLHNQEDTTVATKNHANGGVILILLASCIGMWPLTGAAQQAPVLDSTQSVARNWNEALLFAIRHDFARPTVHARNLFHTSAAMYDAWATFDDGASPYFLGSTTAPAPQCTFSTDDRQLFTEKSDPEQTRIARDTAISYASYRLLNYRFRNSPGADVSLQRFADLFAAQGFDSNNESSDIRGTTPSAALGNLIAACIIDAGNNDGANENNNYANLDYQPVNTPLNPAFPGTPGLVDPNHWQPLQLDNFIDQSGNTTDVPIFLGAEWGRVTPFALTQEHLTVYTREGVNYPVFHDPGPPALLSDDASLDDHYQWGHSLVSVWSSHLDPSDGVLWDISPASIGNTVDLPADLAIDLDALKDYYRRNEGGSVDRGHKLNPFTGLPYEPQIVPRGDYTRVLAEFWADGPDSETPPGHWFGILNEAVSDHPEFKKQFAGSGPVLDDLKFDVYAYFILGAAMHDSAIAAWGIKGWYDYVRPLSALRYLSSLGQSSDITLPGYHLQGIALEPGFIESVKAGEFLAGNGDRNVGKTKVLAWRGPGFVVNPESDYAGVDWILLENWWPYQRPTFVTPPFAGYVSGHSTFSRAAAEVLARITGDEFFPGGMGEFVAKRGEFLVFEEGPSVDVRLQWATFKDASDQTSLSRIWGGIHPPVDDLPGRLLGVKVGNNVFDRAVSYFNGTVTTTTDDTPAPSSGGGSVNYWLLATLLVLLGIKHCSPATRRVFASVA